MFKFKPVSNYLDFKKIVSLSQELESWKCNELDFFEKLVINFADLWDKKLEELTVEESMLLFDDAKKYAEQTAKEIDAIKKKQMMISGNIKNS